MLVIRHHPNLRYPPLVTMYAQMVLTLRKQSDNIQRRGTPSHSRVHFQGHQGRTEELDGETSSPDETPRRTTAPEQQQYEQVCTLKGSAQYEHDFIR